MLKTKFAYLYIAPVLILFCIFIFYPLIDTISLSFYQWNGFDIEKIFVGIGNYLEMFQDPVFYISLRNFCIFALLVITIQMLVGFLLAYSMRKENRLYTIYKVLIFIPITILPVVTSFVFSDILAYADGPINSILRNIGLEDLALGWTSDTKIVLFTIIAIVIWSGVGFSMMVYSSALTTFPEEILESSLIDGANKRQIMTRIVWPVLISTHYSLTIIGLTSALKIFDIIYILTRGGPDHASEMLSTYLFSKAFRTYEQGFASAIGTFMIVFVMILTIVQIRQSKRTENN